jgi:hypothetical protein
MAGHSQASASKRIQLYLVQDQAPLPRSATRSSCAGRRIVQARAERLLPQPFFFSTLVAFFFFAVFRLADDLVLSAAPFDFLAVFVAVFFEAFAAFAIVFAARFTGLGSRFATAVRPFFAAAFTAVLARSPAASATSQSFHR